jgi:hypothetical protein
MKKTSCEATGRPRPRPILKPLTLADATAFYGSRPQHTMRGYAVMLDGKPVALGGITYRCGMLCAFSEMKDELRPYKVSIARFARRVEGLFGKAPGMAIANPAEPGSGRFLQWLGFEHVATTKEGEVYRWDKPLP